MNFKKKQIILSFLILTSIAFPFYSTILLNLNNTQRISRNYYFNVKSSQWVLTSPIIINQSVPTQTWAYTASNFAWCSGSGTWADPYKIQNVIIDMKDGASSCITIFNSTSVYFQIKDCVLINSGWGPDYNNAGIRLIKSNNGFLINNNCSSHEYIGIYLSQSDNNTISGNIANENQNGIELSNSHNNTIINNAVNLNNNGIYIIYSHNNTINGNIANANDIYISNSQNCSLSSNIFTYGGIAVSGTIDELNTLQIDLSNLANTKQIYYSINKKGLMNSDFVNPGQIILVNCSHSIFTNFDISYTGRGLYLDSCDNITISNGDFNYNDIGISILESSFINISDNNANNNNYFGISLSGSDNCTVSGNTANGNFEPVTATGGYGIYVIFCEDCTISGNTANNNFNAGLEVSACNEMKISANTFSNQYCGIKGSNLDNSIIDGNIINGRLTLDLWSFGIYFTYQSFNNTLKNNQLTNCGLRLDEYDDLIYLKSHDIDDTNLANSKPIYYYVDQDGLTAANFTNAGQILLINTNNSVMDNLQIFNTSIAIWLLYSNGNTISNCNLKHNKGEAIILLYSNDTVITGNIIDNNVENALLLRSCKNNNITDNSITDDRVNNPRIGISIQECDYCNVLRNNISNCYNGLEIFGDYHTISFNNICDNRDDGIQVWDSHYNIFNNNTVNNNGWNGFSIEESNNNGIFGNIVNYNRYGLWLYHSNDNTITGNTFYCNREDCWKEEFCTGNTFSDNICEECPEEEGRPVIPGYNLILIIGLISLLTTILMRKRYK